MAVGDITAGLRAALEREDASLRLRAAMGCRDPPERRVQSTCSSPRCAVEPDFFVRDMLTWALTRHPASLVVDAILPRAGVAVPAGP